MDVHAVSENRVRSDPRQREGSVQPKISAHNSLVVAANSMPNSEDVEWLAWFSNRWGCVAVISSENKQYFSIKT